MDGIQAGPDQSPPPRARISPAWHRLTAILALILLGVGPAPADEFVVTYVDAPDDAAPRRTDPGGDGPFDSAAHRLPELVTVTVGTWAPDEPELDLFIGEFTDDGLFVRLDLCLSGLVNPPGSTHPDDFEPFAHGPHPVYGFLEFDLDEEADTGGELDAPEYRYVSNVVRFGGKPAIPHLDDRIAVDASAFDGDLGTPPYVERSGEEFHLALLGSTVSDGDIMVVAGDGDSIFEAGETWWIEAPWFHRAHGFEEFSFAQGGNWAGEYAPECLVQFEHDPITEVTQVSLVFPLTNEGAGLMRGEPPEPLDADPSNQYSVLEALDDLHESAEWWDNHPSGFPEEELIIGWADEDPEDHLESSEWRFTALLGTSYTASEPPNEYFVWTDAYPNGLRGDVNGDDAADEQDRQLIDLLIAERDGDDGEIDGRVVIADFAWDFNVTDINHGGIVDELDIMLVSAVGDRDDDGDVDLADFAGLQSCFSGSGSPFEPTTCGLLDIDADGDVDFRDLIRFERTVTGPVDP